MNKWTYRGLRIAEEVQSWSKDRTKIGACLMRPNHTIASVGYNGLPPGLDDDEILKDRALKNTMVMHAEENAIHNCGDHNMKDYTMFVYGLYPCAHCASVIVSKGIKRVYGLAVHSSPDWAVSCANALMVFRQAECDFVPVDIYEYKGLK